MKCCWGFKSKMVCTQQKHNEIERLKAEIGNNNNARRFYFKELQKATNDFSIKLGIGELSSCYKGTLENGTVVAVKVFRPRNLDMRIFIELRVLINMMSDIKHPNVVEFIGCCVEDDHIIIVYEFMEGGSLAALLDGKISELSWPVRASICLGIARGLECLHDGLMSLPVLHRDIRPSNVLLDHNFNPKIVDFGIAHVFMDYVSDDNRSFSKKVGYIDPEYLVSGISTMKGDVYAFGVVLLEVISGRRVANFDGDGNNLVSWAQQLGQNDRSLEVIDQNLSEFPEAWVKCFIDVALCCVSLLSNLRPKMSEVSLMLSEVCDSSKNTQNKPELSR